MDMRFGTWNVRSLYRAGSLMTVSKELAGYKLDLVGVREIRWEGGGTEPAGEYTFFYGKGNENQFGSKRDEVTGEWRKLHNEELRDL
jgi:hypothetical protein